MRILAGLLRCSLLGMLLVLGGAPASALDMEPPGSPVDLRAEESFGGHTLREHVGRSAEELGARLARSRISAASSFLTVEDAQRGVADVLQQQSGRVQRWAEGARPGEKQAFQSRRTSARGISVTRDGGVRESTGVRVVLKRLDAGGRAYFVLTAFPF